MGFIEDLTTYVWNWFVWMNTMGLMLFSWNAGAWGLLFDDDDGALQEQCYSTVGGLQVTFPVEYMSVYAEA